jgi:hypothetical protein
VIQFILIIFVHVGPMGDGNSNSLTSVTGFRSEAECVTAGEKAKKGFSVGVKSATYVCVKQSQQ